MARHEFLDRKGYVLSAHTVRGMGEIDGETRQELRKHGFEMPKEHYVKMFDGLSRKVDDRVAGVFAELEAEADDDGAEIDVDQPRVDGDVEPNDEEKRLIKKLRKNMGHPASSWQDRFARIAHAKPHICR